MPSDPTAETAPPHAPGGDAAGAGEEHEEKALARPELGVDYGDGDLAFSETLPPETARFGEPSPVEPSCEWCNARLPDPDAARCPSCGALLQPLNGETEVPGLTTISTAARAAAERAERQRAAAGTSARGSGAQLPRPSSRDAYEPPSEEVRAAMREIEREAATADPQRDVEPGPLAEGDREEAQG